jgi:nucleotide-binding universal stress UspA family protein
VAINKIIVGCDGSDRSRDALSFAAVLARAQRARLILTHVYHGERAVALDLLSAAERSLPYGVRAEIRVIKGGPVAHALRDLALAEDADLIVTGAFRGAIWSGPHAVAPPGFADEADPGMRVVGVAFDATPEAREALDVAADLALRTGAALKLIGVAVPIPPPTVGAIALYAPNSPIDYRAALQEQLDSAADSLPASLRTQVVLAAGDASDTLIEQAGPLSLLVMGSHGRGRLRRALLGSVSTPVLRAAPCPVLVVPHEGRAHEAAA